MCVIVNYMYKCRLTEPSLLSLSAQWTSDMGQTVIITNKSLNFFLFYCSPSTIFVYFGLKTSLLCTLVNLNVNVLILKILKYKKELTEFWIYFQQFNLFSLIFYSAFFWTQSLLQIYQAYPGDYSAHLCRWYCPSYLPFKGPILTHLHEKIKERIGYKTKRDKISKTLPSTLRRIILPPVFYNLIPLQIINVFLRNCWAITRQKIYFRIKRTEPGPDLIHVYMYLIHDISYS